MSTMLQIPVVSLKPKKALPFFSRHPWLYATAIKSISQSPQVGAEVLVQTDGGQFVGRGLYNPHSKIRVRLYSWTEDEPLDHRFWRVKIRSAAKLRQRFFSNGPNAIAYRLIFSESDGLSGLTVDRFGDWLVLQWTSAALATRGKEILDILQEEFSPRGIWLRTEKGIRELEGLEAHDGLLAGEPPPRPLFIEENGVQFGVDLVEGQKTGFYLDQRENRQALTRLTHGAKVVDVCTYTGSFAIYAASVGECANVLAIDSSKAALKLAERNAELNGVGGKIDFEQADAFDALEGLVQQGKLFDVVVLDPPKMVRTRGALKRAIKGYIRLNRLALSVVEPDGLLLTCSCSGHVSRSDFEQIIAQAALEAGRTVQILEQRGQSPDHPVISSCLETSYLKAFLCRVT